MNIHFYLNNEEETQIQTYHDMVSNPFKVGDIINLNVDDIYPAEYNKFRKDHQKVLLEGNRDLKKLFNLKRIKIVREDKYSSFNKITDGKLIIEYHCEFVNED